MLQVLARLKARKLDFHTECLEPQKSFEVRPETSECEAEESYPASIDSRYGSEVEFSCGNWGGNSENALSAILNDQESHVSAKPMEQRVSREMEHMNSFHPSICPRDLPELETDVWGSGAQELDIGVEIELAHQENPQHLCLTHEDLCAACGEKSHEPKYLKIPRLPKPHEPHKHINSKSTQIQQDS